MCTSLAVDEVAALWPLETVDKEWGPVCYIRGTKSNFNIRETTPPDWYPKDELPFDIDYRTIIVIIVDDDGAGPTNDIMYERFAGFVKSVGGSGYAEDCGTPIFYWKANNVVFNAAVSWRRQFLVDSFSSKGFTTDVAEFDY